MNPLTYSEIYSWAKLKNIEIYPYEVGILKKLDLIFLSYTSKKFEKDS